MKRKKKGICAICGTYAILTKDHIPPQCIFPKPRSPKLELITVNACSECNNGTTQDDEKFKIGLAIYVGCNNFSTGRLFDSAKKSLRKNRLLSRKVIDTVKPLFTESGLYTGLDSVTYDKAPILRTCLKIVRGLFYHHFLIPVPKTHDVSVVLASDVDQEIIDKASAWVKEISPHMKKYSIGNSNEFAYGYAETTDQQYTSIWIITFYEEMAYVGFVFPKEKAN